MKNISYKSFRESQKTRNVFSNFIFEHRAV